MYSLTAMTAPREPAPKALCPHPWPLPPATSSVVMGASRLLAQGGQGVIFAQNAHRRVAASKYPFKSSGDTANPGGHLKSLRLKSGDDGIGGFCLLEAQFRGLPHFHAGVDDQVLFIFDKLFDLCDFIQLLFPPIPTLVIVELLYILNA